MFSLASIVNRSLLFLSCAAFLSTPGISYSDQGANDKRTVLKGDYGYMLLDLDIGAAASSLHFAKYRSSSISRSEQEITFAENEKGFKLISLRAGRYQITRIDVPFYDLPYKLGTRNLKRWSFSIEEGAVNYIGKLTIEKERTKDDVDINLYNHLAKDLDRIKTTFAEELITYPLVVGVGYTDNFLSQYDAMTPQ